jgi:TetR/AcrR family transcriptional repressor of nem operon
MRLIAAELHTGSAPARRRNAMAIYGMMVGALQLARAANDRKLSNEMLESAIEGALALAGER